jgi:hypothetical protein
MAAYAVSAIIRDARPRRRGSTDRAGTGVVTTWSTTDAEALELDGRPIDEIVAGWWSDLRVNLSQTTFFLFDPESWR